MIKRGRTSLADTRRANALAMAAMAISAPKELSQEAIDLATPAVRSERVKRALKPSARPLERDVSPDIYKAIRKHPKVAWLGRFNRGKATYQGEYGQKDRHVWFNTVRGLSDSGGMLKDGRALWIEVKRDGKGNITPDQQAFVDMVNANNGVAGIVWTMEMALQILEAA